MPETLSKRVTRLESGQQALIDSHLKTEEQFRETDRRLRELGEKTDARIASLVSAIGELISRIPPSSLAPKN
jgi:hypothetical protein